MRIYLLDDVSSPSFHRLQVEKDRENRHENDRGACAPHSDIKRVTCCHNHGICWKQKKTLVENSDNHHFQLRSSSKIWSYFVYYIRNVELSQN